MAEFSDNQFSWVNWLTTTAEVPLADATLYSNNLMNYGVEKLEHLQNELKMDGNFLISSDIGVKKGHANRIKSLFVALRPRNDDISHLPPNAGGNGQVKVSSGTSILLRGKQGHHDVLRKVTLASAEGAVESLRREYGVYGRLSAIDMKNNHFPRIYGLEENFPLPSNLQSNKTGATGLAMVMELGIGNFFEFVEELKRSNRSLVHDIQDPLFQIFDIIADVHQSDLVWMDFKPQNVVVFQSGMASRQFKGIDFDHAANVGTRLDSSQGFTVRYASPEQVRPGSFIASPAQDYWSLGVMLIWIASPPGQDMYSMMGLSDDAAIMSFLRDSPLIDIQSSVDGLLESFKQSRDPLKKFTAKAAEGLLRVNPNARPSTIDMMTQSEFVNCIRTRTISAKIDLLIGEVRAIRTTLSGIVMGDHECPRLAVLIPDESRLSNMNPLMRPHKLYFICPVTLQLGNPYEIKMVRQWVVNAGPAIRIGLSVLKLVIMAANIAGSMYGIPPILPNITDIDEQLRKVDEIRHSFLDYSSDGVDDEAVRSINSINVNSNPDKLPSRIQERLSQISMSQESFSAIRNLLPESNRSVTSLELNSGLNKVVSDKDGSVSWVHLTAADRYRRYGMSCFQENSTDQSPKSRQESKQENPWNNVSSDVMKSPVNPPSELKSTDSTSFTLLPIFSRMFDFNLAGDSKAVSSVAMTSSTKPSIFSRMFGFNKAEEAKAVSSVSNTSPVNASTELKSSNPPSGVHSNVSSAAKEVEFPQEEKHVVILPVPPSIQVDDENVVGMKQWLMNVAGIDAAHSLTYARMIVSQNKVLSWSKLKNKLISDPGFLYRDCNIRNDDEMSIMQGQIVKSRLECVNEKSTALSIEIDQETNEILSKQLSWIESDRELSSLIDLKVQSCLSLVESICGGDDMMMNDSKNQLDDMIAKSRIRLRQGWELIVACEFDSASNRLLTQMKPVTSIDELGSHLSSLPQAMDGSLRAVSSKFGPDDEFVKTKMDSIMNHLMVQYGLIKRGFEALFEISGHMKQEMNEMCQEIVRNLADMKWDDVDGRLTSVASDHENRLTGMRSNLNLSDEWFGVLIRPFQLELDGFVSEKRSGLKQAWDEGWRMRMRPCQNELESRRVIVDILKQTRGILFWNGPDDDGNQFNWSEELPLSEWDGSFGWKRIVVDENGLITKLHLNELGMQGVLPECIGRLTSLTVLDVGINQLTHIPDSIGILTSLALLSIERNPFTSGLDEVKRRFGRDGLIIQSD